MGESRSDRLSEHGMAVVVAAVVAAAVNVVAVIVVPKYAMSGGGFKFTIKIIFAIYICSI